MPTAWLKTRSKLFLTCVACFEDCRAAAVLAIDVLLATFRAALVGCNAHFESGYNFLRLLIEYEVFTRPEGGDLLQPGLRHFNIAGGLKPNQASVLLSF
jgi:hypothetical protein